MSIKAEKTTTITRKKGYERGYESERGYDRGYERHVKLGCHVIVCFTKCLI